MLRIQAADCKENKNTETRFIWDGDVVAIESVYANMSQNEVAWFYEPDSFRPLARAKAGTLFYIVNDHLGTPKEMVSEGGRMMWAADHDTWGTVRLCRTWKSPEAVEETGYVLTSKGDIGTHGNSALARQIEPDPLLCPIRFQGQWEDEETGLYYNRFRYYEPGVGQYLSFDPIRLAGGLQPHAYVDSPNFWSDPLGLGPCRCCAWGRFSGEVGDSLFTPTNPAELGLPEGATIPFNNGTPDFGQFTQSVAGLPGEFSVPGLTGQHGADRRLIIRHMSQNSGLTQSEITRMIGRSGADLRLHHVGGDRIQVVPAATHRLPHYGGAAELRDNC